MLRKLAVLCVCGGLVVCAAIAAHRDSPDAEASHYRPAGNWLQLPRGFRFHLATAVATDKDDNLFVAHRGTPPIVVFDRAGRFLRAWGTEEIMTVHGLRIDRDGNVWITDLGTHQVTKYDPAGKLLLRLGVRNRPGDTVDRFNMPADVAISPAGDIYVADGYGNARVIVFSKTGRYLRQWGRKGTGPGKFNCVHAIVLDDLGRVYVGDRENDRIQVFDADGKFREQWRGCGAPFGLFLDREEHIFVADGRAHQVRILDRRGTLMTRFGGKGNAAGAMLEPHGVCAGADGAVYVAEGDAKGPQKFVPR